MKKKTVTNPELLINKEEKKSNQKQAPLPCQGSTAPKLFTKVKSDMTIVLHMKKKTSNVSELSQTHNFGVVVGGGRRSQLDFKPPSTSPPSRSLHLAISCSTLLDGGGTTHEHNASPHPYDDNHNPKMNKTWLT